jgi:hypothetical protein
VRPEQLAQAKFGAVCIDEAVVFLDHGTGRKRPAPFGKAADLAAELDLLGQQRLPRVCIGCAFIGKPRVPSGSQFPGRNKGVRHFRRSTKINDEAISGSSRAPTTFPIHGDKAHCCNAICGNPIRFRRS